MAERKFTWDPAKDRANRIEHGIGLDEAKRFDWNTASINVDEREDYGELRETAFGFIGVVLHFLVFTVRGDTTHIISLRKASQPEVRTYVYEATRLEIIEMGPRGRDGPPRGRRDDGRGKRRHHRRSKS